MRSIVHAFICAIALLPISLIYSKLNAHELPKTHAAYSLGLDVATQSRGGLLFRKRWDASYIQFSILASGELGDTPNQDDFMLASDVNIGRFLYRGNFETIELPFSISGFGRAGVYAMGRFDEAVSQPMNSLRRIDVGPGVSVDLFNPDTTGFELSFALSLLLTLGAGNDTGVNRIGLYPSTSFLYNWQ